MAIEETKLHPTPTVTYVEPNFVTEGLTNASDGPQYDRVPDLEDYCIAVNIGVEVSSREYALTNNLSEKTVIIMAYRDDEEKGSQVSFMSGTKVGGIERDENNNFVERIKTGTYNAFTTYPMDMYVTDLVNYGTTEMIGVKSINIDYNSGFIPKINMKLTDVRGMSLFQPKEINYTNSFEGIRGLSKDNIAQTFFQCFFTLPLPKFTLQIKGFYGKPVTYQMMCDKFETSFDSANGYFDIDVEFIGYGFSFMSDIAFDALLAAPYSDFYGKSYWDDQVAAGRFVLEGKDGQIMPMPRLYDAKENFDVIDLETKNNYTYTAFENGERTESDENGDSTQETDSKRGILITNRKKLLDTIDDWFKSLSSEIDSFAKSKGINEYSGTGKATKRNYDDINLSALYLVTDDFPDSFEDLVTNFSDEFKKKNRSISELIKNFDALLAQNGVNEKVKKTYAKNKKQVLNKIGQKPKDGEDTNYTLVDNLSESYTKRLTEKTGLKLTYKNLYNNGKEFIYAYVIIFNVPAIPKQTTNEDTVGTDADENEKVTRFNQEMFAKMNWYPTIENFTKIVLAHLETLMAMMYKVAEMASGRTVSEMGLSFDNCSDVNKKALQDPGSQFIPPFPRVTKIETEASSTSSTDKDKYQVSKKVDAWIGSFNPSGDKVPEIDMVNGLFNGIYEIYKIQQGIDAKYKQNEEAAASSNNGGDSGGESTSTVKYPLTPIDLNMTANTYVDESKISENIYDFAGKVCIRMFDILAINTFRYEFGDEFLKLVKSLGTIEAKNFLSQIKIKDTKIFRAINEGGAISTGDAILRIVTGEKTIDDSPWGSGALLTYNNDTLWLDKYKAPNTKSSWVYPVQNISFSDAETVSKAVGQGKYPLDNDDYIISHVDNDKEMFKKFSASNKPPTFHNFNMFYATDVDIFKGKIENLTDDSYSSIKAMIEKSIDFNEDSKSNYKYFFTVESNGCSFIDKLTEDKIPKDVDEIIDKINELRLKEVGSIGSVKKLETQIEEMMNENDIPSLVDAIDKNRIKEAQWNKCKENYKLSQSNLDAYVDGYNTSEESISNYCVLTEVFGTNYDKKTGYKINTNKSFFLTLDIDHPLFKQKEMDYSAHFLMGICGVKYDKIEQLFSKKTFVYIPNFVLLQIGAYLKYINEVPGRTVSEVKKHLPISKGFDTYVIPFVDTINKFGHVRLIKHFENFTNTHYKLIRTIINKANKGVNSEYTSFVRIKDGNNSTVALNQENIEVKALSNYLLETMLVVRGNVNSFKKTNTPITRGECKVTKEQAIIYLDAFLTEIRNKYDIGGAGGNLTSLSAASEKTTEDMKMELYRYLKQIYDKWIPGTTLESWHFDKFFKRELDPDSESERRGTGHQFHFVDSYYNKINKKLLINPFILSEKIAASIAYTDINVMMHTFLADVYAQHRCMLRCIQNFADLSNDDDMKVMFKPLPYTSMGAPKIHPDFVVIYTYEPSKNLNVDNGEFTDDGFMLNEREATPLAITSRHDTSNCYKIPAFGVAYGKQYQSYFKSVNVSMASPIQTQQAIIAKHAILKASHNPSSKTVTAQDLYDIYSTQSYTCEVEMMGCAWVQPMMYFVLLNIPMFRGSYMIMKVVHSITPGNMTTKISGCRMANVANRMIQNIFSEGNKVGGSDEITPAQRLADLDNNCLYKVYPLIEDRTDTQNYDDTGTYVANGSYVATGSLEKLVKPEDKLQRTGKVDDESKKLSKIAINYLIKEMKKQNIGVSDNQMLIIAAGIAGNMGAEQDFIHNRAQWDSNEKGTNRSAAGGVCTWWDKWKALQQMLANDYEDFDFAPKGKYITGRSKDYYQAIFNKDGDTKYTLEYQCGFVIRSVFLNKHGHFKTLAKNLKVAKSPMESANQFLIYYEMPPWADDEKRAQSQERYIKEVTNRGSFATVYFNYYTQTRQRSAPALRAASSNSAKGLNRPTKPMIVMIDRGHGVNTNSKFSPELTPDMSIPQQFVKDGRFREWLYNKHVATLVYQKLKEKANVLNIEPKYVVPITEDSDVGLRQRARNIKNVVNEYGKDNVISMSFHANAAGTGDKWMNGRGWSCFIHESTNESSKPLSAFMYQAANNIFRPKGHEVIACTKDGCKGAFTMCNTGATGCPSILFENFFFDNKEDLKYLTSQEGINTIVNVVLTGLENYLNYRRNGGVVPAIAGSTSAPSPTSEISITNDNIYELLFNAVQKTLNSAEKASANIKYLTGNGGKMLKPMVITLNGSGVSKHLANVYDVLMNVSGYYKYVQTLGWGHSGDTQSDPVCVIVEAAVSPKTQDKRHYLVQTDGKNAVTKEALNNSANDKVDSASVSSHLLMILKKKYGDIENNSTFKKENPQFENIDKFKDISITDCDTLVSTRTYQENSSGNGGGANTVTADTSNSVKSVNGNDIVYKPSNRDAIQYLNENNHLFPAQNLTKGNYKIGKGFQILKTSYGVVDGKYNGYHVHANLANLKDQYLRKCTRGSNIVLDAAFKDVYGNTIGGSGQERIMNLLYLFDFNVKFYGRLCRSTVRTSEKVIYDDVPTSVTVNGYTVSLEPGDVCRVDGGYNGGHWCIWSGKRWVSDTWQSRLSVHGSKPENMWIYSYYYRGSAINLTPNANSQLRDALMVKSVSCSVCPKYKKTRREIDANFPIK